MAESQRIAQLHERGFGLAFVNKRLAHGILAGVLTCALTPSNGLAQAIAPETESAAQLLQVVQGQPFGQQQVWALDQLGEGLACSRLGLTNVPPVLSAGLEADTRSKDDAIFCQIEDRLEIGRDGGPDVGKGHIWSSFWSELLQSIVVFAAGMFCMNFGYKRGRRDGLADAKYSVMIERVRGEAAHG